MNAGELNPVSAPKIFTTGRAPWRCRLLLGALVVLPRPLFAQLTMTVAANTQYEYNTNIFALSRPLPLGFTVPGGGSNYGDSFLSYGGKLDSSYQWSLQQFFATAQGSEIHFDRFTELDHSNYSFDGGWNWRLGRIWDGVLEASRVRTMVSFSDLIGTELVLLTEQREVGKINLRFTPEWRAEFAGITRQLNQPEPSAPGLTLTESSGLAAFKYVAIAGVTGGVTASHLEGNFKDTGTLSAPSYSQNSAGLTATDEVTGFSTFRGEISYTRRSSASDINNLSGFTGELDYDRNFSEKTAAQLQLMRKFSPYLTNTGSALDSVAVLTVKWQATDTTGVSLGYNFDYRQLPNQGNAPIGSERIDRTGVTSLIVNYAPLPWLTLQPYFRYQERSSRNYFGGDFNSTVAGLQFFLQWQSGAAPNVPFG